MRRFLIAVVAGAIVALTIVWLSVPGRGISAVGRHAWPLEARVMRAAWRMLVPKAIRTAPNPVPATADVLKEAREHWADHCATCHDNDGSGDTIIGGRVFPRAPDMRATGTQNLSDGELFYAIEQGIPWTAMPGWTTGTPDGERASWALVRFIRYLPSITADDLKDMESLNPKAPPNPAREREIQDFLNGPPKGTRGGRGR